MVVVVPDERQAQWTAPAAAAASRFERVAGSENITTGESGAILKMSRISSSEGPGSGLRDAESLITGVGCSGTLRRIGENSGRALLMRKGAAM